MGDPEWIVGIGGAAGDGVASAGNTLALALARQGLAIFAYNSYQSVIRGGHSYLRIRVAKEQPYNHGEQVGLLIALNQETLDRHLQEMKSGGVVLYNEQTIQPSYVAPVGVQLCPLPLSALAPASKEMPVLQNTVAVGALFKLLGCDFSGLESALETTFAKKPATVTTNVDAARAGFEYAGRTFKPYGLPLQKTSRKYALVNGNELLAMGAALGGCKFYVAYPMSPATHILEWFAGHARELGICTRQVEDEISVINMAIGAGHMGVRSMCGTSGGGFALMTEAIGMAGIFETPVVIINVQRAGPSTGVPTKTEQADLNQAIGASQGDFPRIILAPASIPDCFPTSQVALNLADCFQCPVIILGDMYLCENNATVLASDLEVDLKIDRGDLVSDDSSNPTEPYLRYKNTISGISPRALPGLPAHMYVSASDEHDEDGVLLSDVYTDPVRRKKMMDKRVRKFEKVFEMLPPLAMEGPGPSEVTLVGWGSTWGVIREAAGRLQKNGISANSLHVRVLWPFQAAEMEKLLANSKKIIVVENNQSGQFARHLRAETGIAAHGHIRKYDGEPFEPAQLVTGVMEILKGRTVVVNVLSDQWGGQTNHPSGAGGAWAGMLAEGAVMGH